MNRQTKTARRVNNYPAGALPIDPTKNVSDALKSAEHRADDLREMSERLVSLRAHYLEKMADQHERFDDKIHAKENQIADMRESFQDRLAAKEAGVRDSYRQFDREV